MRWLDWLIVGGYLSFIVWDGLRRTKNSDKVDGFVLGNRSNPWWAVGLSVMATQLSAITLVGTTGQGYRDGLRFVQFYFGLPLAMIILSVTAVPFFYRAGVYTAYEYLERRFDAKTRALTSVLFLLSRGLQCGVIIAAPSVILSVVMGWSLPLTVLAIGLPTAAYTMLGGVQAVTWTDVKQMVVIITAVCAAVATLVIGLPSNVSFGEALHVAGATGRLTAIDFSVDPANTYTFWSGLIGGLFLMLSYFGCDQSQVQRYLTAKSVEEGRQSLFVSAYVKIPLQALILLTGVLVFTHYLFVRPPMLFNPMHDRTMQGTAEAASLAALDTKFGQAFAERRDAATALAAAHGVGEPSGVQAARAQFLAADGRMVALRKDAVDLVKRASGDQSYTDVNYVFPTFITTTMPMGLVGLMIAAIFAAAMSAIGAELNALATASMIDVYKRWLNPDAADRHYLLVSRTATGCWALVACTVALYAARLGSLIEVVNRFGSFFYGSLLGVFMLAIGTKRATGTGAFVGLIAGMSTVAWVAVRMPSISFLWYNVIGATAVVVVGLAVSAIDGRAQKLERHA